MLFFRLSTIKIKHISSFVAKIVVGIGSLPATGFLAVYFWGQASIHQAGQSATNPPPSQSDDFLRSGPDVRLVKKNLIVDGDVTVKGNLTAEKSVTAANQSFVLNPDTKQLNIDADVTIGGSPENLTVRGNLIVQGNSVLGDAAADAVSIFGTQTSFNGVQSELLPADKLRIGGNSVVVAALPSDPAVAASVNGQIYYNTTLNKFRAFENGAWKDVIKALFTFLEDFTSGFDTTRFFADKNQPSVVIDTTNNNFRVFAPAAASVGAQAFGRLVGLMSLRGDFDMRVDYQAVSQPQPGFGANVIELIAISHQPSVRRFHVSRTRNGDGFGGYQLFDGTLGTQIFGRISSTDASGKLRIQREGARITGYFASGASNAFTPLGDLLFGDEDVEISILVAANATGQDVEAILDNWKIEADAITP